MLANGRRIRFLQKKFKTNINQITHRRTGRRPAARGRAVSPSLTQTRAWERPREAEPPAGGKRSVAGTGHVVPDRPPEADAAGASLAHPQSDPPNNDVVATAEGPVVSSKPAVAVGRFDVEPSPSPAAPSATRARAAGRLVSKKQARTTQYAPVRPADAFCFETSADREGCSRLCPSLRQGSVRVALDCATQTAAGLAHVFQDRDEGRQVNY